MKKTIIEKKKELGTIKPWEISETTKPWDKIPYRKGIPHKLTYKNVDYWISNITDYAGGTEILAYSADNMENIFVVKDNTHTRQIFFGQYWLDNYMGKLWTRYREILYPISSLVYTYTD